MTYNFGGRQSGFCSSPVKEITLLEKLGHDVPIIIERCDVVLFQEANAEWAPNIVASFPGTWNLYFAKEPTLFTCRNSDVRQTDEMSAMLHVPGSAVQQQCHEGVGARGCWHSLELVGRRPRLAVYERGAASPVAVLMRASLRDGHRGAGRLCQTEPQVVDEGVLGQSAEVFGVAAAATMGVVCFLDYPDHDA